MPKLFKILLTVLLVMILIPVATGVVYLFWEKDFKSNISQKTCVSSVSTEDISFDEKIRGFVFSQDRSAYMEFSKEEVLSLLSSFLMKENSSIVANDICIDSSKGVWKAYINIKINNFDKVWFVFDIIKDNRETAELYVDSLSFGNLKLPSFASDSIKNQINKGISDALILVNENSFSGRSISNIELLENKVIVKGTL